MPADQLAQLRDAYAATVHSVRNSIISTVETTWYGLDDYRDTDVDEWARFAARTVHDGQRQISRFTDVMLADAASIQSGSTVRPTGVPSSVVTDAAMRGVDALEVYGRGGPTVWNSLSKGKSLEDAVATAANRMAKITATDLQLAKTHTARYSQQRRGVQYFRRVLRGSENCALCVVASTQRYRVGDLAPIHPGCDCGVEDLHADEDPGQIIEPQQLDEAHQAILETYGTNDGGARIIPGQIHPQRGDELVYRDVRVAINQHGEIGPVLGVWGQKFTGPGGIAA